MIIARQEVCFDGDVLPAALTDSLDNIIHFRLGGFTLD